MTLRERISLFILRISTRTGNWMKIELVRIIYKFAKRGIDKCNATSLTNHL